MIEFYKSDKLIIGSFEEEDREFLLSIPLMKNPKSNTRWCITSEQSKKKKKSKNTVKIEEVESDEAKSVEIKDEAKDIVGVKEVESEVGDSILIKKVENKIRNSVNNEVVKKEIEKQVKSEAQRSADNKEVDNKEVENKAQNSTSNKVIKGEVKSNVKSEEVRNEAKSEVRSSDNIKEVGKEIRNSNEAKEVKSEEAKLNPKSVKFSFANIVSKSDKREDINNKPKVNGNKNESIPKNDTENPVDVINAKKQNNNLDKKSNPVKATSSKVNNETKDINKDSKPTNGVKNGIHNKNNVLENQTRIESENKLQNGQGVNKPLKTGPKEINGKDIKGKDAKRKEANEKETNLKEVNGEEKNDKGINAKEINDKEDNVSETNEKEASSPNQQKSPVGPIKKAPFSWAKVVSKTPDNKQSIVISGNTVKFNESTIAPSIPKGSINKRAQNIVELFNDVKIFTKNSTIASRGIINHNLLCYANSTLQALLHCPPFFNLLRMIAPVVKVPQNSNTLDAPILTALLEFYEEYKNIPKHGYIEPIHPSFIISIVKSLGERFKTQIGQQEDAHEFLDILLNGLDEEFLSIFKKGDFKMNSKILQQKDIVIHITKEMNSMDIEEDGDDWVGVGAKNKQFIDRGFKMVNTPITALFSCIYSSTLKCTGEKPKVSHNSSIYLQLEIEPSHIDSVEDAIIHLLEPETIEEKGSITTTKQVSIKALPPILVLQLKNVNYDPLYGQVKIKKELDYPLVLTIPPPEVSLKSKSIPPTQYKLISVIYHHGNEAMAGHYTCDVRYGDDAWFYFNDELVEKLKPESVGTSEHTYDGSPYLLFYQRV